MHFQRNKDTLFYPFRLLFLSYLFRLFTGSTWKFIYVDFCIEKCCKTHLTRTIFMAFLFYFSLYINFPFFFSSFTSSSSYFFVFIPVNETVLIKLTNILWNNIQFSSIEHLRFVDIATNTIDTIQILEKQEHISNNRNTRTWNEICWKCVVCSFVRSFIYSFFLRFLFDCCYCYCCLRWCCWCCQLFKMKLNI